MLYWQCLFLGKNCPIPPGLTIFVGKERHGTGSGDKGAGEGVPARHRAGWGQVEQRAPPSGIQRPSGRVNPPFVAMHSRERSPPQLDTAAATTRSL